MNRVIVSLSLNIRGTVTMVTVMMVMVMVMVMVVVMPMLMVVVVMVDEPKNNLCAENFFYKFAFGCVRASIHARTTGDGVWAQYCIGARPCALARMREYVRTYIHVHVSLNGYVSARIFVHLYMYV